MSSDVDPTADMDPFKHRKFGETRKLQGVGHFQPPYTRRRDIRYSRYATRFGDAGPCAALRWLHSRKSESLQTAEMERVASDAVHLLCGRDRAPIGSFKVGFNRVLKEAGVLFGSDGKRRMPYSLRRTYATTRISEGVNIFQLAANMGTSVEMIDDFYGKKRMRDPRMATEVTKRAPG